MYSIFLSNTPSLVKLFITTEIIAVDRGFQTINSMKHSSSIRVWRNMCTEQIIIIITTPCRILIDSAWIYVLERTSTYFHPYTYLLQVFRE